MDQPLISVVITNFNYGKYIGEAIDSVLAQTYRPVELIVVDDGSTDNSLDILQQYAGKVQLIRQSNKGVVAARNRGLGVAKGEYVCFLDADDKLDSRYLAELYCAAHRQSAAIAYCDTKMFGAESAIIPANRWNWRKLLYRNYLPPAALISRRALEYVGGYTTQDNVAFSFEDWDLWLKLAEHGFKGAYVPEPLFLYRLHGAGRNQQGLARRVLLEKELRRRHAGLYGRLDTKLYLLVFRSASRLRNKLKPPPGT